VNICLKTCIKNISKDYAQDKRRERYQKYQGELEHRRLKRFYVRTNKGKKFEHQISTHQRRERLLQSISLRVERSRAPETNVPTVAASECEPLAATAPKQHHHISSGRSFELSLFRMIDEYNGDLAFKVIFYLFIYCIIYSNHILPGFYTTFERSFNRAHSRARS